MTMAAVKKETGKNRNASLIPESFISELSINTTRFLHLFLISTYHSISDFSRVLVLFQRSNFVESFGHSFFLQYGQ